MRVAAWRFTALALAAGCAVAQPGQAQVRGPGDAAAGEADRQQEVDVAAQRQALREQRRQAEAARAAELQACARRFAVVDCENGVRERWRDVLEQIRRQDLVLSEAERRRRSEAQLRALDQRAADRAAGEAQRQERAAKQQRENEERAAAKAGGVRPSGSPRAVAPAPRDSGPGIAPEQARANAEAYERRQQEAQERKRKAREREARRAEPAASGLPVPP